MRVPDSCAPVRARRLRQALFWGVGLAALAVLLAALFFATRQWPRIFAGIVSNPVRAAAVLVFAATYIVIAIGKLPGFYLDRAGAALIGASLMVASGTLSLDAAFRAIDPATIVLLLGMMILVANLRFSGFFGLAAVAIARFARHPVPLLVGVIVVSGALSAFLVNDTVCLMLTPLVARDRQPT